MMKKNIDLERRSVDERNSDHFQELQKILDYAQLNSEGWKSILGDVISMEISDRKDLQKIPITRKSDLSNLQRQVIYPTEQLGEQKVFSATEEIYKKFVTWKKIKFFNKYCYCYC